MDFDLAKSIQVSGGQITGSVTPTFNIGAVGPSDSGAYIDEFDAGVVSVNATAQSFVIQGPHGRNFTVNVNGNTEWDNNESLSALTTSSIVSISGILDRADATIDADEVAILSQNGFYADGQVTYVTPASGAATSFDLYVRGLLPASTGLTLGQIAQVDLSGSENFFIHRFHNPLTQFLFNSSLMLPGQAVAIGGPGQRREVSAGGIDQARGAAQLGIQRHHSCHLGQHVQRHVPDAPNQRVCRNCWCRRPCDGLLYLQRHSIPSGPYGHEQCGGSDSERECPRSGSAGEGPDVWADGPPGALRGRTELKTRAFGRFESC